MLHVVASYDRSFLERENLNFLLLPLTWTSRVLHESCILLLSSHQFFIFASLARAIMNNIISTVCPMKLWEFESDVSYVGWGLLSVSHTRYSEYVLDVPVPVSKVCRDTCQNFLIPGWESFSFLLPSLSARKSISLIFKKHLNTLVKYQEEVELKLSWTQLFIQNFLKCKTTF